MNKLFAAILAGCWPSSWADSCSSRSHRKAMTTDPAETAAAVMQKADVEGYVWLRRQLDDLTTRKDPGAGQK